MLYEGGSDLRSGERATPKLSKAIIIQPFDRSEGTPASLICGKRFHILYLCS